MSRTALFLSLAALAAGGAARAQEAVATARATGAPPAATDTAAQVDSFIHKAPPVNLDDGTPDGVTAQEDPRRIHGEVGASLGTGGYRSAYVMSTIPLGKTATLGIAVSETRFGRHGGSGWGGGFSPYGDRQSLGLSLALGEAAQAPCHGQGFDSYSPVLPLEGGRAVCRAPLAGR
jgi:hypothetical protein